MKWFILWMVQAMKIPVMRAILQEPTVTVTIPKKKARTDSNLAECVPYLS